MADMRYDTSEEGEVTGWVGWLTFGGIMLLLIGMFHGFQGLVSLFNDDYYAVTSRGLIINVDYTTWGWVHLLGGVVLCLAGAGLLAGQLWARIVGVIVALVSAVISAGFLNATPIWSGIIIAIDVLVIWAITVHGREMVANR